MATTQQIPEDFPGINVPDTLSVPNEISYVPAPDGDTTQDIYYKQTLRNDIVVVQCVYHDAWDNSYYAFFEYDPEWMATNVTIVRADRIGIDD